MSVKTIAVLEPGYRDYVTEAEVLSKHNPDIVAVGVDEDAADSLGRLNPIAILVRDRRITAAEIASCPDLKVIARYGVGVDNVDIKTATERRIFVTNIPDYGAEKEVSEHALALYLSVHRRIPSRDNEVRQGKWSIVQQAPIPHRENAVLGIIGCGKIGLETAKKFCGIGFKEVLGFDPYLSADAAAANEILMTDLETLCKSADVISLHAPYTQETHHILSRERLEMMQPGSIVINVSRGGLVDEIALSQFLCEGKIYGAGLDVFKREPLELDHPILKSPNVVLSDHTAWYSERSIDVLKRSAAGEIKRVLDGEVPKNWVNPWS